MLAVLALAVPAADDANAQAAPPGALASHDPPLPPPSPAVEPNFSSPKGIAVHNRNTVVVADTGNHRVQVFDQNGTLLFKFGSEGSGEGNFSSPEDVAVRRNSNTMDEGVIAVADTGNHRIQVFHGNGTFDFAFGSEGSGEGNFSSPKGVDIDVDLGRIFVADTGNHRIQVFWPNGTFITKFGSEGSGEGNFSSPEGVASNSPTTLFVADTGNHRIQRFEDGMVWFRFAEAFGSEGSGEGQFRSPGHIDVGRGWLLVTDTGNNRVVRPLNNVQFFYTFGSEGSGEGQLSSPGGAAAGAYLRPYVADTYRVA